MFLDNERYNSVLATINNAKVSGSFILSTSENKQALLNEQFLTQIALQNLKVTLSTPIFDIPGIETPYCYQEATRPFNVFISFIGSPNSGRSSTLKSLGIDSMDFGRVGTKSALELKTILNFNLLTLIQIRTANAWYSHESDMNYVLWMMGYNDDSNIVFERDMTDLSFIRANFLFGRIDAGVLKMAEENFFRMLDSNPKTPRVIINTLSLPALSLYRETEVKENVVVQMPFLEVLHEQNLRFHYEMIHYLKTHTPTFNYLAVDMSDPNIEVNIKHLADSIQTMIRSFQKD
jgi:hypothetical protein